MPRKHTPRTVTRSPALGGQGLVEFALVVPFAVMLIFGVISLGLWVFYQQQVTNVAREAARFAAIHSSTAICPTAALAISWAN